MKKIVTLVLSFIAVFAITLSASADNGKVTYNGKSGEFIFEPGSEYSPTDLFDEFKDVMPGDSITQKITVKNDVSKNVKVKIYMRSLGAHEDSVDFLSQMNLSVTKLTDTNLFDASADQTAGLTEWTYLGTLYSGGEAELEVVLDVPVEMTNEYSEQIGFLDWEFAVEELPVEESDPKPPKTGDNTNIVPYIIALAAAVAVIVILLILKRKKKDQD